VRTGIPSATSKEKSIFVFAATSSVLAGQDSVITDIELSKIPQSLCSPPGVAAALESNVLAILPKKF
jgi:hypothetical protein